MKIYSIGRELNQGHNIRFGEIDESKISEFSTKSDKRAYEIHLKDLLKPLKKSEINSSETALKNLIRSVFGIKK